jgi:hypothetical protein
MNRTVKAVVALLVAAVLLSLLAFTQTTQPLSVNGSLINVDEGKTDWTQVYGGSADDRAFYALPVDTNFLVVGSTKSAGNGTTLMGWIMMLNRNGAILWNKTYASGSGAEIRSAVALSDGYLLIGNQFTASGDENGYVAKINSLGDLQWQTVVGGAKLDKLFSGVASGDGYVVCGLSYPYSGGTSQAWAVKLDPAGSVIWDKVYNNGNLDCALRSAVADLDGGCVAAGYVDSGEGRYDFYLQKIDVDGSRVWNQSIGGSGSEKAYSISTAKDGYILAGDITMDNSPTDACIVRVNSEGTLLWTRSIGGTDADSASYITPAKNGDYLVCGFTFSYGEGNRDFWLFSISDEGNVGFSLTYGDSGYQEAYAVLEANSGKYVMFGWTDPMGQPDMVGKATYEFYIARLGVASAGPSLLTIILSIAIFALLVAALLLMIKLRRNKK